MGLYWHYKPRDVVTFILVSGRRKTIMNEQNNKMEKIKRISNIAMRISVICKVFMIMAAVVTFMGGIILLAVPRAGNEWDRLREVVESGQFNVDIRLFGFDVSTDIAGGAANFDKLALATGFMFVMCVLFVLFALTLHYVAKVFKEIRDSDSPFRPAVLKRLRMTFILIVLMSSQNSLFFGVVVAIALWCVYCIVDYGCELQRLSDETL